MLTIDDLLAGIDEPAPRPVEPLRDDDTHADTLAKLSQYPHKLYRVDKLDEHGDYSDADRVPADVDTANVLSSEIPAGHTFAGWHTVTLDIDVPARLVPSSTPGHSHLYIDVALPWEQYATLLHALANASVIEAGYHDAAMERGHTALRLPWIKKGNTPE